MSETNPVEGLFDEEPWNKASFEALIEKCDRQSLVYPDGPPERKLGYIFRGELDYRTPLQSSLERRNELWSDSSVIHSDDLKKAERQFFEEFARTGGKDVASIVAREGDKWCPPPDKDVFWWFSVMQHYRHPTRLIDFTRDIRFALYFTVEQHADWQRQDPSKRNEALLSEDLILYCFPCKDLTPPDEDRNNKSPFSLNHGPINMNDALGFEMALSWEDTKSDRNEFRRRYGKDMRRQSWGWDRPFFENPRLKYQKGMFVYPFDFPDRSLERHGDSWFVGNLGARNPDAFNLGDEARRLPPKRIRISCDLVNALKACVRNRLGLTPAKVYVDFEKVELREYERIPSRAL